jgi:hypothetical protein
MAPRFLLLLVLAAGFLRADELADLRARLSRLQGKDPLRATVDYSFWSRQGDENKGKVIQGKASVRLEEDAQGLKLVCSQATLEQMHQEDRANARDPESGAPTRQALRNVNPATSSEFLDAADRLLRDLEGAVLLEVRPERFEGVQAQCLALKLNPKLPAQSRKYVKDLQSSCKVWLGPDGLPIGLTQEVKAKGRVFLVVSFEHSETAERRFARLGNRPWTLPRNASPLLARIDPPRSCSPDVTHPSSARQN